MSDILDEAEVAALLDCAPRTVQEKASAGELPAVKFGRSWRFPRAALVNYLNELALQNRPAPRQAPAAVAVEPAQRTSRRRVPPALVDLSAVNA